MVKHTFVLQTQKKNFNINQKFSVWEIGIKPFNYRCFEIKIFFQKNELHGLKHQRCSQDLLRACWYTSVYAYQLKQSLSNEPIEWLFWSLTDNINFFSLRKSSVWKCTDYAVIFETFDFFALSELRPSDFKAFQSSFGLFLFLVSSSSK